MSDKRKLRSYLSLFLLFTVGDLTVLFKMLAYCVALQAGRSMPYGLDIIIDISHKNVVLISFQKLEDLLETAVAPVVYSLLLLHAKMQQDLICVIGTCV
jgi:hypothetical protein